MDIPEEYKPTYVAERQVPIETNFVLNSVDRSSGEIYDAVYRFDYNWECTEFIVVFDTIDFKNDQYSIIGDVDFIEIDGVRSYWSTNTTFSDAADCASTFWKYFQETDVTFEYEKTNSYTIIAALSATLGTTIKVSYNIAQLLGIPEEYLFTIGALTTSPIKGFTQKGKWTLNFGGVSYNILKKSQDNVIAYVTLNYPSSENIAQGKQMRSATTYNWNIKFLDENDVPIKIMSDYRIYFRVVQVFNAHWLPRPIPKHLKNLFSNKPVPAKFSLSQKEKIKTSFPRYKTKMNRIESAYRFKRLEEKARVLQDDTHPYYQPRIDIISSLIEASNNLMEQQLKLASTDKELPFNKQMDIAKVAARVEDGIDEATETQDRFVDEPTPEQEEYISQQVLLRVNEKMNEQAKQKILVKLTGSLGKNTKTAKELKETLSQIHLSVESIKTLLTKKEQLYLTRTGEISSDPTSVPLTPISPVNTKKGQNQLNRLRTRFPPKEGILPTIVTKIPSEFITNALQRNGVSIYSEGQRQALRNEPGYAMQAYDGSNKIDRDRMRSQQEYIDSLMLDEDALNARLLSIIKLEDAVDELQIEVPELIQTVNDLKSTTEEKLKQFEEKPSWTPEQREAILASAGRNPEEDPEEFVDEGGIEDDEIVEEPED